MPHSKLIVLLLTFFTVALAAGCGNVHESTTENQGTYTRQSPLPQGRVSQSTLDGDWKTACIADAAKNAHYKIELSIQKDLILSRTYNFSDDQCANQTSEEERLTRFVLDTSDEASVTLTETLVSVKIKASSSIGVQQLNSQKLCGFDAWVLNQFRVHTTAADCGLNETELYRTEIFGNQELHLKACTASDSSSCKTLIFER